MRRGSRRFDCTRPGPLATSTKTEPGFMLDRASREMTLGARAPGTSTAPITRSASTRARSIADCVAAQVVIRPPYRSSSARKRSRSKLMTVIRAPMPTAILNCRRAHHSRAKHYHMPRSYTGNAGQQQLRALPASAPDSGRPLGPPIARQFRSSALRWEGVVSGLDSFIGNSGNS